MTDRVDLATLVGLLCLAGLGLSLRAAGVLRDLIVFYSLVAVVFGAAVVAASRRA